MNCTTDLLKAEILNQAERLASGKVSAVDVSTWAVNFELDRTDEVAWLKSEDGPVIELLESLQPAAQKGDDDELLYDLDDFKGWFNEYKLH